MKKKYIYSALILTAVLCAGCAKEFENTTNENDGAAIELSSVSTDPMTKAVITGTSFTTEEAAAGIGLFLLDGTGATYGSNAGNVRYAHNDGKWTAASPLRIGGTAGTLYGYYPYSSTVTDITAIPVASSVNGTDYLFATPTDVSSTDAKNVSLSLSHALARVSLSFRLDESYSGSGTLSAISLSGDCVTANGTLDATDGSINASKGEFSAEGLNRTVTKSASTVVECLVVPVAIESGTPELRIACTIDGKAYATTFTGNLAALASGKQTTIELTVKNTSITVDGSSIGAWGEGSSQTVTVGGDYKVTVKLSDSEEDEGIADNLFVKCKAESNSVKVEVYSKTVKPLVIRIGDDTRIIPDKDANFCTFTISDVTSDITATLAYAKTFRVTGSIVPDVTPDDEGYLDNIRFEGLGDILEGRTRTVKVGTVPGYSFKKLICDGKTATLSTIVLEGVSKDLEVSAHYEFYDYPLPGVFTVADDGEGNVRKVKFARGNMWYQNGVLYNEVLHNEDEQHHFSGSEWTGKGHISHFMWCKSVYDSVSRGYEEPYATANDNFFTNAGNDHLSPNPDLIVNGQKGIWRVLSHGEWSYLLNGRTTTYGHRFAEVNVNGTYGLLILPDIFTWPSGAGDPPTIFDESNRDWDIKNYEGTAFLALQEAGCVFLPAAGYRDGNEGSIFIGSAGVCGLYWSSSPNNVANATYLKFGNGAINPFYCDSRSMAQSVRLVTDCQ